MHVTDATYQSQNPLPRHEHDRWQENNPVYHGETSSVNNSSVYEGRSRSDRESHHSRSVSYHHQQSGYSTGPESMDHHHIRESQRSYHDEAHCSERYCDRRQDRRHEHNFPNNVRPGHRVTPPTSRSSCSLEDHFECENQRRDLYSNSDFPPVAARVEWDGRSHDSATTFTNFQQENNHQHGRRSGPPPRRRFQNSSRRVSSHQLCDDDDGGHDSVDGHDEQSLTSEATFYCRKPPAASGSFRSVASSSSFVPSMRLQAGRPDGPRDGPRGAPPRRGSVSGATSGTPSSTAMRTGAVSRVEVFPGVFKRLRGADETKQAIQDDFYVPLMCYDCEQTIFCIQDADYVICPFCRVVSPLAELLDTDGRSVGSVSVNSSGMGRGGVGLGFTLEDLARFQDELLWEAKMRQKDKGSSAPLFLHNVPRAAKF